MDELLKKVIESLEIIALRSYWETHCHCESQFQKEVCKPCKHYDICDAEDTLNSIQKER